MDAKRAKTKAARERKMERAQAKRAAQLGEDEKRMDGMMKVWRVSFQVSKEGVNLLSIWAYAVMFMYVCEGLFSQRIIGQHGWPPLRVR